MTQVLLPASVIVGAAPVSLRVHHVVVNRMTATAKSAKDFHAARAGLNAASMQVRLNAHDDHVARIALDLALAIPDLQQGRRV